MTPKFNFGSMHKGTTHIFRSPCLIQKYFQQIKPMKVLMGLLEFIKKNAADCYD